MANLWTATRQQTETRDLSVDAWIELITNSLYAGQTQTLTTKGVDVPANYLGHAGVYKGNGVVFACNLARLMLFSEVRLAFQRLNKGRPGDLFWAPSLSLFDTPGLFARMIQDADLAGNWYGSVANGQVRRMRPDWVTIILGSNTEPESPEVALDGEVIQYMYQPGGAGSKAKPVLLDPRDVAHFKPIPDPLNDYRGMSWLTPVLREIQGDSLMTTHKGKFFENGATPNMVVKHDKTTSPESVRQFIELMKQDHAGVANAYKTLHLGGGADPMVVGTNFEQAAFRATQGAGEVRIAAAAGMHPVVMGMSESLAGSSLNAGNFGAARRLTGDKTLRPLWRDACEALSTFVAPPGNARLWYDATDISFLQEDVKDAAEVEKVKADTIVALVRDGFDPKTAIAAVMEQDMSLLNHTGRTSVQLKEPGEGDTPAETPTTGDDE